MTTRSKSVLKETTVAKAPAPQTVLIAVTGLSPAILTETIWALASQHQILPDRVVLITTLEGKRNLEKQLFEPKEEWGGRTVWEALRSELDAPENKLLLDGYRIMTGKASPNAPSPELEDIRNDDDNAAAADFILHEVRKEVLSSSRLIASIAGGRKTMGTLLYASMSLVARPGDWITHVIVNAPYDGKLFPDFYFNPVKPILHEKRDIKTGVTISKHSSSDACIQLARIPFVPLSVRFKDLEETEQPDTFLETVSRVALKAIGGAPYVANLAFDFTKKTLVIDGNFHVEMENLKQLQLLEWLCKAQGEPFLPDCKSNSIFQAGVELCKAWHGAETKDYQVREELKNYLKLAKKHAASDEAPSWVESLEPRDFTKMTARIREKLPTKHPWKTLPEKTLKLPALKIVKLKH